jgi:hypothetical protein
MSRIRSPEKHRQRDILFLADNYLAIRDCPGGRPIIEGYVCPHCGTDTSYGECGGVVGFARKKTKSPSPILDESGACSGAGYAEQRR